MIAHVAGAPVEELLPFMAGMGVALLLARAWVAARLRGPRDEGTGEACG